MRIRSLTLPLMAVAFCATTALTAGAEGDEAKTGAQLFVSLCASCHGAQARGDGPVAPLLVTPPSDLTRIQIVTSIPVKPGKLENDINMGIESVYQCLLLPGFDHKPEMTDDEISNTDGDHLDKPLAANLGLDLNEWKDAWGNPFVYLTDADYAKSDKEPILYRQGSAPEGEATEDVPVHAWKLAAGPGYAQPGRYQLFSMGPDGIPNTEDDIKAWE